MSFVEKNLDQADTGPGPDDEARRSIPMKIAFCLPDQDWLEEIGKESPKDAAYIQQQYIADGLKSRGHSLTYLAPQGIDRMICTKEPCSAAPARQTWSASKWFNFIEKAAWKIEQFLGVPYLNYFSNLRRYDACLQCLPDMDMVFERNGLYNVGVAMACRKLGLPYVMFFDADQIAEHDYMGKPIKGMLRWRAANLLRRNLKTAERIICVSEQARRHLMNSWEVPPNKIVVLPNGVDVDRFKPDPKLRAESRASLKLETNPVIVFVGSFYQWHDVKTLLVAFSKVLEANVDARLILVGDGEKRESMEHYSETLKIDHAVKFTGFVSHAEVSNLVNVADIAVVPVPAMENDLWLSPMKLFEYMASGKAVVASAMGQIINVIRDGENGLLVQPGDPLELADALNRLIGNPELCEILGRQAREDAVTKHSWKQYVSQLEKMFSETVLDSTQ